ncbi:MAG TPA: addiction module protein [Planctomycetota bacterium]|nr:addiction module protein [Planctomycetota bacterium]
MTQKVRQKLFKLSIEQKLELIGELWNSIGDENIKLSQSQEQELDRRLQEYRDGKVKWVPAEEAEKEIQR